MYALEINWVGKLYTCKDVKIFEEKNEALMEMRKLIVCYLDSHKQKYYKYDSIKILYYKAQKLAKQLDHTYKVRLYEIKNINE